MSAVLVDVRVGLLSAFGKTMPCAIGRGGACPAADKREGDGRTPLGTWPMRTLLVGPAMPALEVMLPWRRIRADDGWCDAPGDPAYNRPVRLPYPASAETMLREDGLYDLVVTLGHNDAPPVRSLGSAIFLHCWRDAAPTEGCVAIAPDRLAWLVAQLRPGDTIIIC